MNTYDYPEDVFKESWFLKKYRNFQLALCPYCIPSHIMTRSTVIFVLKYYFPRI